MHLKENKFQRTRPYPPSRRSTDTRAAREGPELRREDIEAQAIMLNQAMASKYRRKTARGG